MEVHQNTIHVTHRKFIRDMQMIDTIGHYEVLNMKVFSLHLLCGYCRHKTNDFNKYARNQPQTKK